MEDSFDPVNPRDPDWYLGERQRHRGSIHQDVWEGTAADLLSNMASDPSMRELIRVEDVRKIGRKLGQLISAHSNRVEKASAHTVKGGSVIWKVTAPWVNVGEPV